MSRVRQATPFSLEQDWTRASSQLLITAMFSHSMVSVNNSWKTTQTKNSLIFPVFNTWHGWYYKVWVKLRSPYYSINIKTWRTTKVKGGKVKSLLSWCNCNRGAMVVMWSDNVSPWPWYPGPGMLTGQVVSHYWLSHYYQSPPSDTSQQPPAYVAPLSVYELNSDLSESRIPGTRWGKKAGK